MLATVAVVTQDVGTVYERLGSDSQLTAPELATLINLYSNVVPAGRFKVVDHKWLALVYPDADSAIALLVSQLPRAEMDPTILTV